MIKIFNDVFYTVVGLTFINYFRCYISIVAIHLLLYRVECDGVNLNTLLQ